MSFAAPCLDFWPNMSLLINPWINYPLALTIRDGSQRKYLAHLIFSILKNFKSNKGELHKWLKQITYFNFGIDASKGSKARRRYSETFGVSRERARQMSLPSQPLSDYLREFQKEIHEIGVLEVKDQISKYILSHPGSTRNELDDLFRIDHTFTKWLDQKFGHLILKELDLNNELTLNMKRIDVLESLRDAATLHWPLTTKNYQDLLDAGFIDGLSCQRILQIYGSWKNACDEAKVECGEAKRDAYTTDFSADECIRFVGDYLTSENSNGTADGYLSWRECHQMPDRVPSFGTLRNRVHQSWVVIVRLALEKLRDQWSEIDSKESIDVR